MGFFSTKSFNFLSLITLVFLTGFVLLAYSKSAPDYTTLVYKGCANQTFSDQTGIYSQTLTALFDSLISQSSKTKFFKTSSGGGQTSFTGLYQCRGDLSNGDCYNCVSKLPEISDRMCGKTVAGRIQLYGCYILYELAGFPQISGVQMLYKSCSASQAAGSGFEERRDTAFAAVESGMVSGNGFYTTSYESVYAMAQCEGDLSMADCGECVKTVVQQAQVECGSSISGQIYLHKCYMSYSYYPNGISRKSSSVGTEQNTGKTIAIVVGGAAGVGFGVICLMFIRSLLKKHDDY
ncbi:Gnk2-homologous domain [Macleaya cordata]|uniref:Gnk2-homologous domain n=1 Tax=Macleaya cordata TaxID=56857 RepID=A0A200PVS1_MACCD|nr:Gnk2-homologous domain [Macleaya cordata]